MCNRIFEQMGHYPIDIIGNYGMQYAEHREDGTIEIIKDIKIPCNKNSVEQRVTALRKKYGFEDFAGDNVEYHSSGCVTFPILGTKAKQEDKLAFDPDRKKRRAIYKEVCETFPEFTVFVGGSSSFDMAPHPYNKAFALAEYCKEIGLKHSEVAYVGDDYGLGGNDESVYLSDFNYVNRGNLLLIPGVLAVLQCRSHGVPDKVAKIIRIKVLVNDLFSCQNTSEWADLFVVRN